ncbi:MAG: ChbG/HpnK family deacetylase [Bacteroidetes bacterium]|nr:MAG: ChbG/HpnK family deacetylase [Bacteroidota bacterium]
MKYLCIFLTILFTANYMHAQSTYAERLGFPKGKKVIILHIDDVGMSYDSNLGAIKAMEEGVANSLSIMMPCAWVPGFMQYLKAHPEVDAGLHLTLTSEWDGYRWGPLAGKPAVPGLVDPQWALWPSVRQVVEHATPDEVEREIRAQLQRSRDMGWEPTHLDSHMGTLFATPAFLERYIKVGAEEGIPVMFPGGHCHALTTQLQEEMLQQLKAHGKYQEGMELPLPPQVVQARQMGGQVWAAGLPVLDDLHNSSYGWRPPQGTTLTKAELQEMKTQKYIQALKDLKPGLTMVIMHCTAPTEVFPYISDSGPSREGDMLAMMDPRLRAFIEQEGIILTTWRELKIRRDKLKE